MVGSALFLGLASGALPLAQRGWSLAARQPPPSSAGARAAAATLGRLRRPSRGATRSLASTAVVQEREEVARPAAQVPLLRRVAAACGRTVRASRELVAKGLVHVDGRRCLEQAALVAASSHVVVFLRDQSTGGLTEVEAPPSGDFYLKFFKPRGVICSHRKEKLSARPIVADLYPRGTTAGVLHSVGRLDRSSEGLLLLSSDGTFSRFGMMPELHVEKEYMALTNCAKDGRPPSPEVLSLLRGGVELNDGEARANAAEVVEFDGRYARLRLVVTEGRFHIVRRMLRAVGYSCLQLLRTRIGNIRGAALRPSTLAEAAGENFRTPEPRVEPARLGDPGTLRPGEYAALSPEEVQEIYRRGLAWTDKYHPV